MRVFRGATALDLAEGEVLGWGSESVVYGPAALPGFAAKVYHAPRPEHGRRLEAMLASPPADPPYPAFTWPAEPLHGEAGEVVGFLMPRIPRDRVPLAELFERRTRRAHVPAFTYRELLWAARSLAERVYAVHPRGHVVGDLDEGDLLVAPDARVTMVDTDSFQIRSPATGEVFRCATAQPDLTPPELQGIRPADVDRAPEHDRFGLAVLLFQLLMEGAHPFTGVCAARGASPSRSERIRAGEFAYAPGGSCRPAPLSPRFELLDPGVRALFTRCFVEGHSDPSARPTAAQWDHALARAEASLRPCDTGPRHLYGAHLAACPWCERARVVGGDPFPPSDDTLPPLDAPPAPGAFAASAASPAPEVASAPEASSGRGPRTTRVAPKTRKPRMEPPPVPVTAPPVPAIAPRVPMTASAAPRAEPPRSPAAPRPEPPLPPVAPRTEPPRPPAVPRAKPPLAPSAPRRAGAQAPPPVPANATGRHGVNPFMGLALLLALAGVIPPLREVAWGLAIASAVLGTVFARRWGGAGQLQLAGAVGVVVATLVGGRAIREMVEERLAAPTVVAPSEETGASRSDAPRPKAEPAPPSRAPRTPKGSSRTSETRSSHAEEPARPSRSAEKRPARATPKPRPRSAPKPKPAPKPRTPARSEPRTTIRTETSTTRTPSGGTTRTTTRRTETRGPSGSSWSIETRSESSSESGTPPRAETRRTPAPTPRRTPTAPTRPAPAPVRRPAAPTPAPARRAPPPAVPSTAQLTAVRADLAVAQALKNQGAYYDAGVTLRGARESVAGLAARYPGARSVAELDQRVRSLTDANRRACQAEAAILRSRGEGTSPCP